MENYGSSRRWKKDRKGRKMAKNVKEDRYRMGRRMRRGKER